MKSENIDQIAASLCKAQAEFRSIEKDSINPHFKNRYASLAAILEAVRPILMKNGLSIAQLPTIDKTTEQNPCLETLLIHVSGQWIASHTPLILSKNDMQGMGSAITYARRYGLTALLGVAADEDDDGQRNADSLRGTPKNVQKQNQTASNGNHINNFMPQTGGDNSTYSNSNTNVQRFITTPQVNRLYAIAHKSGWTKGQVQEYVQSQYGLESPEKISSRQGYETICNFVASSNPASGDESPPADDDFHGGKLPF